MPLAAEKPTTNILACPNPANASICIQYMYLPCTNATNPTLLPLYAMRPKTSAIKTNVDAHFGNPALTPDAAECIGLVGCGALDEVPLGFSLLTSAVVVLRVSRVEVKVALRLGEMLAPTLGPARGAEIDVVPAAIETVD